MQTHEKLMEMSVPKRKAEQIVTGLEQPINLHLLKLLGFDTDDATRLHWKKELRTWLYRIASITIKPDNKPIPAKLVFLWLYDEPFGGTELQNVESSLNFLSYDYKRNNVQSTIISNQLKKIHQQLAEQISKRNQGEDIIEAL